MTVDSSLSSLSAPGSADFFSDEALLERTMRPYAGKDCVYLKNAQIRTEGAFVAGSGVFSIQESCYIEETGHFNAVEFNISYNQLFYYTLAAAIRDSLLEQFSGWTLAEYWPRQLPSILIHSMSSKYSRPINSRNYSGDLVVTDIGFRNRSQPLITVQTQVEFRDDTGGRASGEVSIVVLDPPGVSV